MNAGEKKWRKQAEKYKEESKRLRKELKEERKRFRKEIHRLQKENDALKKRVEEVERGEKREEPLKEQRYPVKPSVKGKKKRPGRKPGFKGTSRRVPDHADEVIDVKITKCPHCGTPVQESVEVVERYVEDYTPPRSHVTKYRIHRHYCPHCKKMVNLKPADVIPRCMLGMNVMLFIAYQRCELRLPYAKIRENVMLYLGIRVTNATIYNAVSCMSRFYKEEYVKIRECVRKSEAVYTDETGWRKDGINVWLWAFATEKAVLYKIDKRRSSEVPKEVLGEDFEGVVISDFYSAYNKLTYKQQKCIVHLLRETKKIAERNKETQKFHKKIKRCVGDAVHFKCEPHTTEEIARAKEHFLKRIDRIIREPYTDPSCIRIAKRLKKHRNSLFTFLDHLKVDSNNNRAEGVIRFMVIRRKMSGGNRSWHGASNDEILMSVTMTHKVRKENFLVEGAKFIRNKLNDGATSKS